MEDHPLHRKKHAILTRLSRDHTMLNINIEWQEDELPMCQLCYND